MLLINHKPKLIILLIIISFYFTVKKTEAQVQNLCPNSDFSSLNFSGWTGCYCITGNGNCYTAIQNGSIPTCTPILPYPAINCGTPGFLTTSTAAQPSTHTILTPSMLNYPNGNLDSFTNFQLLKIPPGVNQVVRLNTWKTGYETSTLTYDLFVDTNWAGLFIYSYAAVLENPGTSHGCNTQPYFQIRLLDAAGNPLTNPCGSFVYVSGTQGTAVNICNAYAHDINWFDWQTVGLSLKPYQYQNIKIQFIAADCGQSGHFGYAYFYGYCLPRTISIKFCQGTNTAVLKAPAGFRYKWVPGGDTTQTKTVVNAVDSAIYQCIVTSLSNNICSDTLRTVLVPNVIKPTFLFNNACVNMPIHVTNTSTSSANTPICSWKWDFNDPGSPGNIHLGDTNFTHIYTTPGTYNIKLTDSTKVGCVDDTTQTVTIYPNPLVTVNNDSICIGDTAKLIASGASTYLWKDDGSTGTQHKVSPTALTSYVVIGTSSNSCVDSATAVVSILPPPILQISNDTTICAGTSVNITAYGGINYSWTLPSGTLTTQTITVSPTALTTYPVTVKDANGCINDTSMKVDITPLPIPIFTLENDTICRGATTSITVSGGSAFNWNTGETTPTISVQPTSKTVYSVTISNDVNGVICYASGSILQNVRSCNSIYIPNAFSPYGYNTMFKPVGKITGGSDYKFEVWDRWGQLLYESSNPDEGWDGRIRGVLAPTGAYIYHIRVDNKIDPIFEKVGTVTLIQ